MYSAHTHDIFLRSILVLSSNLRLGLSSGVSSLQIFVPKLCIAHFSSLKLMTSASTWLLTHYKRRQSRSNLHTVARICLPERVFLRNYIYVTMSRVRVLMVWKCKSNRLMNKVQVRRLCGASLNGLTAFTSMVGGDNSIFLRNVGICQSHEVISVDNS